MLFLLYENDALGAKFKTLKNKPNILFQRGDTIECEKFNFLYPLRLRDRFLRALTILIYFPLQKWLFPKLDLVVFQADFLRELALKRHQKLTFSSKVIPNDCEIKWVHEKESFNDNKKLQNLQRAEFNVIGFVAPLYWHGKGVGVFLNALNLLTKRNKNFIAVIVGYGPDEQRVKNFIREKKLTKNVKFVGKITGMHRYMDFFDLLVVPTKMLDACPNVVLKQLMLKCPF